MWYVAWHGSSCWGRLSGVQPCVQPCATAPRLGWLGAPAHPRLLHRHPTALPTLQAHEGAEGAGGGADHAAALRRVVAPCRWQQLAQPTQLQRRFQAAALLVSGALHPRQPPACLGRASSHSACFCASFPPHAFSPRGPVCSPPSLLSSLVSYQNWIAHQMQNTWHHNQPAAAGCRGASTIAIAGRRAATRGGQKWRAGGGREGGGLQQWRPIKHQGQMANGV